MGFLTSLADGLDSIMDGLGASMKHGFADYCDLETIDDGKTLVATDGSLCTVIDIRGTQRLRSGSGVDIMVDRLVSSHQSLFEKKGNANQAF